jgi:hypothetical protein
MLGPLYLRDRQRGVLGRAAPVGLVLELRICMMQRQTPSSVVIIATCHSLDALGSNPGRGTGFSLLQSVRTGCGAHPVSYPIFGAVEKKVGVLFYQMVRNLRKSAAFERFPGLALLSY